MLIIALSFPVAILLVALLLARVENWVDAAAVPDRRLISLDGDDADLSRRGEPWVRGVRQGAAR